MNDNVYKSNTNSDFRTELKNDLEENMKKFNDPIVIGELLYKLLEERENTNRILKNILAKLEKLEGPSTPAPKEAGEIMLPSKDELILDFLRETGKATAEDVRSRFKYKGKNAACARLNKLFDLGMLEKKQVGKKVYYFPISN